jgi:general secretion pathway protein K
MKAETRRIVSIHKAPLCMHSRAKTLPHRQQGVALISAMLVVTLVATLASVALWQQWRHVEVESAERQRIQSSWLLNGAFDWTRLILREDALAGVAGASLTSGSGQVSATGGIDHLGEPWALPLKEAKLSTFLAQDQQLREGDPEVFLSGQVTDAQSRINLSQWVEPNDAKGQARLSPTMQLRLSRLFGVLGLPGSELETMGQAWLAATQAARSRSAGVGSGGVSNASALLPQQMGQLQWLGVRAETVAALAPFVTILPESTPVNLNTASPEVIYASVGGLDLSSAQKFVQARGQSHFVNLTDAAKALGVKSLDTGQFSLGSRYFEVWGRLRLEDRTQEETALILRDAGNTSLVWRQKIAGILPPANQESLLQSNKP